MKPQTRMTQPTVSFFITDSEISAARLSGSVGAIMNRPTMVPASSDSMVRCDHTARMITTRVGIRAKAAEFGHVVLMLRLPRCIERDEWTVADVYHSRVDQHNG